MTNVQGAAEQVYGSINGREERDKGKKTWPKLSEIDIWDVLLLILKHVHIHGSFIMALCFLLSSV